MNPRLRALVLCAVPVASALALTAPAQASETKELTIKDFLYSEDSSAIEVGQTVNWTNNETGIPHTVTSKGGEKFDSGIVEAGKSFSHTFATAGVFHYECTLHPQMTGKVVVGAPADAEHEPGTEHEAGTEQAALAATEENHSGEEKAETEKKSGKKPGKDNALGIGIIAASLGIGLIAGPVVKLASLKQS